MQTFKPFLAVLGVCSLLLTGCSKESSPPLQGSAAPNAPVLKIAVFADGRLTVEGTPTTVPALRQSLWNLKGQQGVVWYYRETAQKEPPPIAMEVMRSIVDQRLPVKISSRPDYSDLVDATKPK